MQRPILKPIGSPLEGLDTPALVVDIASLRRNITTVHRFFSMRAIEVRPDVSVHCCPAIAREEVGMSAMAGGISTNTLGQAEVFAQYGFTDISIRCHVTTEAKIVRLCLLSRRVRVQVVVDTLINAEQLSEAAEAYGVVLPVLVEIKYGKTWCGVEPGQVATETCTSVASLPGLAFAGLAATVRVDPDENVVAARAEAESIARQLTLTTRSVERIGMRVPTVSIGGVDAWVSLEHVAGITEVILGRYSLADAAIVRDCPDLSPAARVLSTVTSCPEPGRAIADAGQKAVSSDGGLPLVEARPNLEPVRLSAEHCLLDVTNDQVQVGEKLWLIPADIGVTANLHDYIFAGEAGKLVAVWDVAARGRYD